MAASGGPVQDLFEEATCSICLEYFKDPVIIPECGHNFCRACLIQYWGKSEGEASCPECRKTVQQRNLIPNRSLANVAEKAKMLRGDFCGRKRAEGKERVCEKHQEPLKLFCKEDESPICLVCERSKEHKSHEVVPLEEASQEYMNQICRCLGHLRKEREKIMAFKMDAEEESQDLLNQMEAEMEKTVAEFRCLHRFLEEQEKRLLFQMAEVEKEIAKKREEHLARLSGELSSLESLIQEVEEKLQEPASELLQDIGSFLWRYQEKFEDPPMAFPPALKWRIWDFGDINPFLEGVMKQFRDTLGSGFQLQQENVTLDPDTAHPHLVLSEDRKRVRFGDEEQDLPNNCERFDKHPYVLGGEGFTGGRHFWEVVVGSEGGWAVGVARKSVKRKGQITFGPEEGVWGLGKWAGEYKASSHAAMTLSKEPERIRVALNCEGGRVSFYDADRAALLYTFSAAPFSGETLLPLFWVPRKAHLTLSD
ncbi:zinc finger protein RFP-like isoform X1 [Podarcis muralis]